jgi:hypothetical protein
MSLADGCGCALSIRLGKDRFAHNAWDMACVARHMLTLDVVRRSSDPVLRTPTLVSEDLFGWLARGGPVHVVELDGVRASDGQVEVGKALGLNNLFVNLSCRHTEQLVLGGHEASVAW